MKKILFVSPHNLNKRYGGALATKAYYNAFITLYGTRVKLMMPAEGCYGEYKEAIAVPKRNKLSLYLGILTGHFHRYYYFVKKFLRYKSNDYSLAIINGGFYAGDIIDLFHLYGIKTIVIHHNYEVEYHMDNKTIATLNGRTAKFVERNERRAYLNADVNVFLTTPDMQLFERHYGLPAAPSYLLNVFEPEILNLKVTHRQHKKKIVITGCLDSIQTIKGIKDFSQYYFKIVRELCQEWEVILAGRNPSKSILQFAKENPGIVNVIANPENMDSVIQDASIFLCPTNVGGGLKLRIMDGLKNGIPVLTHSVSARGYETFFNKPFFKIYHDEISFKKGLTELLEYSGTKNTVQDIYSSYISSFGFESGCKRVREIMRYVTNE